MTNAKTDKKNLREYGAGKTTTFRMITGEILPDSGKVFLNNVDISKIPMYKRARLGIAYLPQEPSAFR
jgi:lipopolysaccharide export system ATP-binding protein